MEKTIESKVLQDKLKEEINVISKTILNITKTIGQIELNKYNVLNSEDKNIKKIAELEISKNALIVDFFRLKENFKEKIKEGLISLGIKENEIEEYAINIQTGEINRKK